MPKEQVFKKYVGKSGRTWFVSTEDWQNNIYVSADPRENKPEYRGARGYNGNTLRFKMEDGSYTHLMGPWHSSPGSFTEDTGVEL